MITARQPRGMFGAPMLPRTPGIGDDILRRMGQGGVNGPIQQPMPVGTQSELPAMAQSIQRQPKKPGMDWGRFVAGTVGDWMLQQSGGRPLYAPMMLQRQQDAREAAMAQQKAQTEEQGWRARKQWEWANEPQKPTALQQNYDFLKSMGGDYGDNYLERMSDNSEYRVGPDGRFYRVDNGGVSAPVGKLTIIPDEGGGAGNGVGGFPGQ